MELSDLMSPEVRMERIVVRLDWQTSRSTGWPKIFKLWTARRRLGSLFVSSSLSVLVVPFFTCWVLAGHRPSYVSTSDVCPQCREAFETTMNEFSVDLVLAGHSHVYERSAPVFKNVSDPNELNNPKFPWYIVNGAAGHYDGLDVLDTVLNPFSRAAFDTHYGWSRLTFHNCTHLTQDFVSSADGSILDSATLFKDRSCN